DFESAPQRTRHAQIRWASQTGRNGRNAGPEQTKEKPKIMSDKSLYQLVLRDSALRDSVLRDTALLDSVLRDTACRKLLRQLCKRHPDIPPTLFEDALRRELAQELAWIRKEAEADAQE